ncbi:MAG: hypothetical protein R3204_12610, partial [Oceanospirillum sp.]|nr:hypothetical protein [Oceanospirillum sp.]
MLKIFSALFPSASDNSSSAQTPSPTRKLALALLSGTLLFSATTYAGTKDDVIKKGDLDCGVFPDDPGRSAINDQGRWEGFYVDFCRATAAAVLGNPEFVSFIEVGAKTRFTTLMEKKTDVVMY